MIRTIVMRIDRRCRSIVVRTLRERSSALQTRNTLELGLCVAQLIGQGGMLGALTVEYLSFKVIRLVIGRCALVTRN